MNEQLDTYHDRQHLLSRSYHYPTQDLFPCTL